VVRLVEKSAAMMAVMTAAMMVGLMADPTAAKSGFWLAGWWGVMLAGWRVG